MKKALALLLAVIMTLSLVACGKKEAEEPKKDVEIQEMENVENKEVEIKEDVTYKKELVMGYAQKHTFMDPQAGNTGVNTAMGNLTYNQLVGRKAGTSELIPELATSWEVDDSGLVWTFKLRDDVTFCNGEKFTADDVLFTMERAIATGVSTSSIKSALKEVRVVDDYTVEMETNTANMDFVYNLVANAASILNREACEADPDNGWAIGTGGWKLDSWIASENAVFSKYADSWVWNETQTPTEKITFKILTEEGARVMALEAGEVDVCMGPSYESMAKYADSDTITAVAMTAESLDFMAFSTDCEVLKDDNLRKAIAYALDRDTICEICYSGYGSTPATMWGPNEYGRKDDLANPFEYNLEKAKEYLAKSNYKGESLEIATVSSRSQMAEVCQALLLEVGINTTVNTTEIAAIDELANNKTLDIFLFNMGTSVYGDYMRRILTEGGNANRGRYADPEIAELLDKAVAETDDAVRQGYYGEVQEIIAEQVWLVPLIYGTSSVMYNSSMEGVNWVSSDFTYAVCAE